MLQMAATRVLPAALLLGAALLALVLLRLVRFVASYMRITHGLRSVPEAPQVGPQLDLCILWLSEMLFVTRARLRTCKCRAKRVTHREC